MKKLLFVIAASALGTGLASCQTSSPASGGIVATNAVLASIVQEIVGDTVVVESVIPDGKDPHEFEPSAGDIAKIANARLVVANGFGYEPTLYKAIDSARADRVTVFDVERVLPQMAGGDPHWFTDPLRVVDVATRLVPVLEESLGTRLNVESAAAIAGFRSIADEGGKRLSTLGTGVQCVIGSEHIFLAPFGERFSCPASAVLHSGSVEHDSEPSAAEIEGFVASITRNNVKVLVEDESEPSKVLEQVARQTGARLVQVNVHALGSAGTYRQYILNIVDALAEAFR